MITLTNKTTDWKCFRQLSQENVLILVGLRRKNNTTVMFIILPDFSDIPLKLTTTRSQTKMTADPVGRNVVNNKSQKLKGKI